jgi:tetratricopeptide (TPR) repeat protein
MANQISTLSFDPRFRNKMQMACVALDNEAPSSAFKKVRAFHDAYPQTAEANQLMARAYVALDDRKKAIQHAELANKINSRHPGTIFVLGRLYLDFHLYEFAAPLLRKAHKELPDSLLINWALANYEMAVNDGYQAIEHYEKALAAAVSTEHKNSIKIELAHALESVGRITDADAIYQELQAVEAFNAIALINRADLKVYGVDSEVYNQLTTRLSDSKTSSEDKSDFLRVLGNIHDQAKQYDVAFEKWLESRKLKSVNYGHQRSADRASVVKSIYTREILERYSHFGAPSEKPLFIIGMPRSGTTLTEQVISAHTAVYGVGELGRMSKLASAFSNMAGAEGTEQLLERFAKTNGIAEMAIEYITLLNAVRPEPSSYVVDKDPFQFFAMGYIHLCFPNAKFIHCNRHPADTFISAYQNKMNQHHDYAYDQVEYAKTYLIKQDLLAHWRSIFPKQIFDLKYESLVEDPRGTVEKLLAFLGLEWQENCLKFFEQKTTVRTFSRDQVRSAIYTSSKERWRNYEKHLCSLFDTLKEMGFDYHRDVEDSTS